MSDQNVMSLPHVQKHLDDFVVMCVEDLNGGKAIDLVIKMVAHTHATQHYKHLSGGDIQGSIERCINTGRIMAINYCLPNMPHREKQFLLPANTALRIEKGSNNEVVFKGSA